MAEVEAQAAALDAERATVKRLTEENDKFRDWLETREKQMAYAANVIQQLSTERDALAAQLAEAQQTIARMTKGA
jgi:hypothetical protein